MAFTMIIYNDLASHNSKSVLYLMHELAYDKVYIRFVESHRQNHNGDQCHQDVQRQVPVSKLVFNG